MIELRSETVQNYSQVNNDVTSSGGQMKSGQPFLYGRISYVNFSPWVQQKELEGFTV